MINTTVVFADGKDLIVHHARPFTGSELAELKGLTSDEFKEMMMETGRFIVVSMKDNPFLNG